MDASNPTGSTVRDRVYGLVSPLDLFADSDGNTYVSLLRSDGLGSWYEVHDLRSSIGRGLIIQKYIEAYQKPPSSQGLKEGIDALAALALRSVVPVGVRTMPFGHGFALNLCDAKWRRALVASGNWEVSSETRPIFRRGNGAKELPVPVGGGSLDKLRQFLRIL